MDASSSSPSSLPPDRAVLAADGCARAADATGRFARACLADPRIYDLEECIEWCLLGSQILGSCANVLHRPNGGARTAVVTATAEAAVLAATGCADAVALADSVAGWDDVAACCTEAARSVRDYLESIPSGDSAQLNGAAP